MDISLTKIRQTVASFTLLAMLSTFLSFAGIALAAFDDTDGHWGEDYIDELVDQGVMSGYEDGTFGPDNSLTRGELAKILVGAALGYGEDDLSADDQGFTDVDGEWWEDWANTAAEYGIMTGYTDDDGELTGEFGGADAVNRAQAAKAIVEAFSLSEDTMGSDYFSDVEEDSWYDSYVGSAYRWMVVDGKDSSTYDPSANVTRAEISKMTVNAQSPEDRLEDDEEDEEPASEATLEVELSDDSPTGDTLPSNATSVELAAWDFTAEGDDLELDDITIHHSGITTLASTHSVYLYMGNERLTSGKSINSSTHEADFNNLGLEIDEGDTVTLSVRMDVGDYSTAGEVQIEIESADMISTNAEDVDGDFPLTADKFDISTTDAGTVTLERNGTVDNPNVGEDGATIAKFKVSASTEGAYLEELGLYLTGTVSTGDVENFQLFETGSEDALAEVDSVDGNDVIRFELDDDYLIEKGDTQSFYVTADYNTGRTDDTVKVYVDEDADAVFRGDKYGFGMSVTRTSYNGTSCTSSSATACNYSTLEGGDITIASNGPSAMDIAVGADDVSVLDFSITTVADVTFKNFEISLDTSADTDDTEGLLNDSSAANFTEIKIIDSDSGEEIWTGVDSTSFVTSSGGSTAIDSSNDDSEAFYLYTDDVDFEAGEEMNLSLVLSVANTADLADMTFVAQLELGSTYPEVRDVNNKTLTNSSSLVPASAITSKTMTVQSPSLSISLASTPVSGGTTEVKGSDDITFVGFVFSCGEASDCKVNDVTLSAYIDEDSTGGFTAATDNSVNVSDIVGSVWLEDGDGEEIAAAQSVNSSTGLVNFTNISWELDAGETTVAYVVGDISADAYKNSNAEDVGFAIDTATDVVAEDADGASITMSDTPNFVSSTSITTYVTTSNGGSLTASVGSDTPREDIIVSGATDVEVSTFKFTTTDEDFVVEQLSLNARQSAVAVANFGDYDNNINKITISYTNSDGETEEKDGFLTDGTAEFTGMDFFVEKDEDATMTVYADINTISSGNATAGEFVDLAVAFNNFEAIASASGETYKADKIDASVDATSDLDFGTITYTSGSEVVELEGAQSVTLTLGSTLTLTIDNGSGDDNTNKLPAGTILCVDDDAGGTCSSEDIYIVTDWPSTTSGTSDSVTVRAVDDAGDSSYDDEEILLYALPGTGYFSNTNQMHVYENKPVLALSTDSPSGDRSTNASDAAFQFTITADDADGADEIKLRAAPVGDDETDVGTGNMTAAGTPGNGDVALTTTSGDYVDGTSGLEISATTGAGFVADGDCFVSPTALTAGTDENELGHYEYVSFWLKTDQADVTYDTIAFVLDDASDCASVVEKVLGDSGNTDDVYVNGTALSTSGAAVTTIIGGGTADQWDLVTVRIGSGGLNYSNLATATNWGLALDAGTTILGNGEKMYIDGVVFHDELLVVELSSDASLRTAPTGGAVTAYLKDGGTTLATAGVGVHSTSGASIAFVPLYGTYSDIEVETGDTETYTVELDTTSLVNNQDGTADLVTFSIDLGSSSSGTVTPGGFWWYESNSTVRWTGQVDSTTLTGNTLSY